MVILNFSHPITDEQRAQVEALVGQPITDLIEVPSQIDVTQPLAPQIGALIAGLEIAPRRWQNEQWLVNPPALNFSAVVLLAELHGRLGYFPPCIRLRPVPDALVPQFEVAEIMNLHAVREAARTKRAG